MNKSLKIFLFSAIAALSVGGCKKPSSEFQLKQYEYVQGQALLYENLSSNNKTSKWEIVDEEMDVIQVFEGAHPNIITSITAKNGVYTLKLTSYSKKEKKESVTEKSFMLKSVKGKIIVNTSGAGSSGQKKFDVYIDNQYVGASNTSGQFVIKIPVGWRLIKLVAPTQIHEQVYEVDNSTIYIDF